MSLRRLISMLLCLVLIVSCAFPLIACNKDKDKDKDNGGGNNNTDGGGTQVSGNTKYDVQVKTLGGMPLSGVMVYVYKPDGSMAGMPAETDATGKATFNMPTLTGYTIKLKEVPEGYVVQDKYDMSTTGAVINLASKPIETGDFKDSYELGDVMYDFTLTDIDGVEHKLSEMLKTKKMVMLNFWYVGCGNCAQEFPYINESYESFKDKIEILAINDRYDESIADVEGYSEYLQYYGYLDKESDEKLNMPLVKIGGIDGPDVNLSYASFGASGWPTTVIIDRYGVVCMIEVGRVLGTSKWDNIFYHFTADDYEQKLITDPSILNPMIEPTIQWTENSEAEIAGAFNSGDINVSYHPELKEPDSKYSWPFVVTSFNGETCIKPSNSGIDNSFSILYADVELKPGQAVTFDWYAQTQAGYDYMFILVDGKDIYSISGDSAEEGVWKTCCTYVDPRPITDTNKDDVETYEIAFAYKKDEVDGFGDDTVYLKNLKVIDVDDIDVETYIFRYAVSDPTEANDGYNTYVNVYLASDGYYHVGDPANDTNAPLLLANLLSYTKFDEEMTVSQRLYAMTKPFDWFDTWIMYGNYASNSQVQFYCTVTEQLKNYLIEYCDYFRRDVGKSDHENLWLQLCAYYDAYGKDKNGNPTEQLKDPIRGLASFSAFDIAINNHEPKPGDIIASETVTYNMVVMPRGYLFEFVPEISGVYRFISKTDTDIMGAKKEINGWIYIGDHDSWAGDDRVALTHYDVGERHCEELLIDPDGDGIKEYDYANVTLVGYMEAGKSYYVDFAYYDVYTTGTFSFDVKYVGENFGHFIQASNGPITYEQSPDGGMGSLIAIGIDYVFASAFTCENPECGELVGFTAESDLENVICANCATKLAKTKTELEAKLAEDEGNKGAKYAFERTSKAGEPLKLGMVLYVDFYRPTTLFSSQSIEKLITANAFNYTITETDREALITLDGIRVDGKSALIKKWVDDKVCVDEDAAMAKWAELNLDAVVKDAFDGTYSGEYTEEQKTLAAYVITEGENALRKEWGNKFEENWAYYKMDDVKAGIFHNTDNKTNKDKKAEEYLAYLAENGEDKLKELWDTEFDSVLPPSGEEVKDISAWRYEYFWSYYQMDDVKEGIYHGNVRDYTADIEKYVERMENDDKNPERQGCVAATEELAEILATLIDREVFEDVKHGWLKFCYYYDILGTVNAD